MHIYVWNILEHVWLAQQVYFRLFSSVTLATLDSQEMVSISEGTQQDAGTELSPPVFAMRRGADWQPVADSGDSPSHPPGS